MALKFYDDTVRDGLAELADVESQRRLWLGMEPDMVSSPYECFMTIFEDSGLGRALESGSAYGEPVDTLLRLIHSLMSDLDLGRPLDALESDPRFTRSRRLAAEALHHVQDRAMGTVQGESLGPM